MDTAGTAISFVSYLGGKNDDFLAFLAVASDNSVSSKPLARRTLRVGSARQP